MKNKNDSSQNSFGESKAAPSVTALRKLFESNFKLSNLTNAFKSKNSQTSARSAVASKNVLQSDVAVQWPESVQENRNRAHRIVSPGDEGCYVDCKIENCCCKTFFRQYDGTPNFRQPAAAKLPLRERNDNSIFDRRRPERWSAASSSSYNLSKERQLPRLKQVQDLHRQQAPQEFHQPAIHNTVDQILETRQSRFYISYDFYKSKAHEIFDETPVSAVSVKRLKSASRKAGKSVNLLEKIGKSETDDDGASDRSSSSNHSKGKGSSAVPFHKTKASGFVNFTAASLSEGGYIKNACDLPSTVGKVEGSNHFSDLHDEWSAPMAIRHHEQLPKVHVSGKEQLGMFQKADFNGKVHPGFYQEMNSEGSATQRLFQKVESKSKGYQGLVQKDAGDGAYHELLHKLDLGGKSFGKVLQESESYRVSGLGFKHRIPKLKNIALREHTHPYSLKKPRLTVKGVKNRNMRNIQRRQKLSQQTALARSQTFGGYDNFAYRRSITDLQLPKLPEESVVDEPAASVTAAVDAGAADGNAKNGFDEVDAYSDSSDFDAPCRPRPASISVIGIDDGPHFHVDSRMTSYNWPVTSFYVERDDKEPFSKPKRSSSFMDLSSKLSSREKSQNPVARKTNLKRHCSLGYLENEFFEYNFTLQRRSLENINSKYKSWDLSLWEFVWAELE